MPLSPFASTLLAVWLSAAPNDDVAAIRAAVADYTEGVMSGDLARLQRTFHPDSKLLSVGPDGALATWPGNDYVQTAVKSPFTGRENAVLQVDVVGSAAVAKVSVRTAKWDFTDYISLLKLEGRWRIVTKVYHREPRAEAPSPTSPPAPQPVPSGPLAGRTVALLVTHGFNLPEMVETRRALEEAGARVELVAPKPGTVRADTAGGQVSEFRVDRALTEARPDAYHALYLPGGTHSADSLRLATGATEFVQGFLRAKKPVAAICHGLWLLADAGGVKGRRVTSFPSLRRDLQNAGATWVDEEVVVDGQLVTSRRPADLPAFNQQVVARFARPAAP
ncbi:DJ-1/PfpI family protein [Myxococcus sp. K38C18041901]|uniref:DJ-1/PfpI family protein n=1 Tax=Myxococcus guangdongensis TaxID=2906760 RepID=UPI0020A777AE|nr:DJ-1/PfpI family protein [Myxococcus guangdongensis]MCP3063679.1 DJ-1/PfpI family protein [Myxococcus guangdongensis]